MKKVISVLLVLALLLPMWASAESLFGKSDQELLSMYQQIQSILLSRSKSYSIELDAGKYTVGTDLPAGSYRLECNGAYASCYVTIYTSTESEPFPESYILAEMYQSSAIGKLDLVKGNILSINGSKVTLTAYNAANTKIAVEQEKSSPHGGFKVSIGKYIVGDEIPAGTYRVVCEGAYASASITVYSSKWVQLVSFSEYLSPTFGADEIGKLELEEGNYVEIEYGSLMFYPYTGLQK